MRTLNNILLNIVLASAAVMVELWAMVAVDAEEDYTLVGFSDTVSW